MKRITMAQELEKEDEFAELQLQVASLMSVVSVLASIMMSTNRNTSFLSKKEERFIMDALMGFQAYLLGLREEGGSNES